MSAKKDKLFDIRVVERNIQKGLITRKEYEDHLSQLDDHADNADKIEAEFIENVLAQDKD